MSNNSTASRLSRLIGLVGAKRVISSFASSRIDSHSVLFYGPDGAGKDELASIVAGFWLCNSPAAGTGADGTCRSCNACSRATNPDLLLIAPGGAGNIKISQLEHRPDEKEEYLPLLQFIRTPPLMSRHKVVIIKNAERMVEAASNTLLKTLEEPPPFLKVILTTPLPGALRATVLSRVLSVACDLASPKELRAAFPDATEDDILLAEQTPGRVAQILHGPAPYGSSSSSHAAFPADPSTRRLRQRRRFDLSRSGWRGNWTAACDWPTQS